MKNKRELFIVLLMTTIILLPLLTPLNIASALPETVLRVDPPRIEGELDKEFDIWIRLDNVVNLFGFEFKLQWNDTLLNFVEREIFPPWTPYFVAKDEAIPGQYWLAISALAPAPPFTGSTTLLRIRFRCVYQPAFPEPDGYCLLDLKDTKLGDPDGLPIAHTAEDGEYFIPAIVPPRPWIKLEPPEYRAEALYELVTFEIWITDLYKAFDFYGWQEDIFWNPTLLEYVGYEDGDFWAKFEGPDGHWTAIRGPIIVNETHAYVRIGQTFLAERREVPYGSGVLIKLMFNATYSTIYPEIASCPIQLLNVKLGNSKAEPIGPVPYDQVIQPSTYYAPYEVIGRTIDVYTETYRWPGYYTDVIGRGPNERADAYAPQEEVTLFAEVLYNKQPVANKRAVFEIHSPHDDIIIYRTATTNMSGIATISFAIPWPSANAEKMIFGDWFVYAKVEIREEWVSDTLNFSVGWLVNVIAAKTTTAVGEPQEVFERGVDTLYMAITVENIGYILRDICITVSVYDDLGVPIASTIMKTTVDPHTTEILNFGMFIPDWAFVGTGTIYINVFTENVPTECGVPYCPEYSLTFSIGPLP